MLLPWIFLLNMLTFLPYMWYNYPVDHITREIINAHFYITLFCRCSPLPEICRDLEDSGYSCFIAPRDIRSGCEYAEELINGIGGCDVMVLLLSEQSNGSPHVLREVERAVSKNKPIVVYKLEEVSLTKSMEYFLMTHQWLERKPGRERSEIIGAIEQISRERRTAPSPAPHEPKPGKKTGK